MPVIYDILGPDILPEQIYLSDIFLHGVLAFPLEGAVRLRHKAGGRNGYAHSPVLILCVESPGVQNLICKLGDTENILVRFRGQAQHEVQLYGVPAALKSQTAGVQQVLLRDVFVYRIAQALAAGLGCEGQTAFSGLLQAVHYLDREIIRPERGQRQSDAPRLAVIKQPVAQLGQMTVVARAEGKQRYVL